MTNHDPSDDQTDASGAPRPEGASPGQAPPDQVHDEPGPADQEGQGDDVASGGS